MRPHLLACLFLWSLGVGVVLGFNGHRVTDGPLTLEIGEIPPWQQAEAPVEVPVTLRNRGEREVSCSLELHGLVDEWTAVGAKSVPLRVPSKAEAKHVFRIAAREGVERALYPVHISARDKQAGLNLHAIRIFECRNPIQAAPHPERAVVPAGGVLDLTDPSLSRMQWELADGTRSERPHGWTGSDPDTGTCRHVQTIDRGEQKRAMAIHPPWRSGPGVAHCEIPVRLPKEGPVIFSYSTAVRDPDAQGNSGDGITFRVRVDDEIVTERHHGSRTWTEERVDLSRWAGNDVRLVLETDPGPKKNTAFDQGYWGEPLIRSGPEPRVATAAETGEVGKRVLALLHKRVSHTDPLVVLNNHGWAALMPGPNGLIDGVIGLAMEGRIVLFQGLELAIDNSLLGKRTSKTRIERVELEQPKPGTFRFVHRCRDGDGEFKLILTAWGDGDGLRLKTDCPRRITRLALGSADQRARRVYAGHGYVIDKPEKFTLRFGGHGLASSHVAADYEGGLSVLTASDHPPVAFEVDPDRRFYSLVTRYDATLTLVPGLRGGLETAIRYRPLYDKPAAPGVAAKAGRFVFDIWGGRYAEITDLMRGAIDYGLLDSMLTVHVWQRWGYDYKLPDIFPPNPQFGSLDELRALSRFCREHEIPWGLHDNYIDFYPDADDYSYERICFSEAGQPVKAWINEGRNAQSYRWRPDAFQPFLERNLALIAPALEPTHSFVDVFTSLPPVEFHDRDGQFHSAVETREHWGEAFATIRKALAGPSVTTSEAGHDQLTGYLDGADCQFLQISPEPERFHIPLKCGDWERVPWMDTVLHDRFSLHGVGYSSRYQGGRERSLHGIESDDYISAEVLTGHALMIDLRGGLPGAARKYWLAQPVARALATDTIRKAGWEKDNLHQLHVNWDGGMEVKINRGPADWKVAGTVLPEFGFVATDGKVRSAIERIDGMTVEQSRWPGGYYVNSRTQPLPGAPLPITPRAGDFQALGDRQFRLPLHWSTDWKLERDARVFLHVIASENAEGEGIVAQGDHAPGISTSKWSGEETSGENVVVRLPADLPPGDYPVVVGLHVNGRRLALLGEHLGSLRYRVGGVRLAADGGLSFEMSTYQPPKQPRNRPGSMVDFGVARTDGAFRAELGRNTITVTPLPDAKPMRIELLLPDHWKEASPSVHPLDRHGKAGQRTPAKVAGKVVSFRTREGIFAYQVRQEWHGL